MKRRIGTNWKQTIIGVLVESSVAGWLAGWLIRRCVMDAFVWWPIPISKKHHSVMAGVKKQNGTKHQYSSGPDNFRFTGGRFRKRMLRIFYIRLKLMKWNLTFCRIKRKQNWSEFPMNLIGTETKKKKNKKSKHFGEKNRIHFFVVSVLESIQNWPVIIEQVSLWITLAGCWLSSKNSPHFRWHWG